MRHVQVTDEQRRELEQVSRQAVGRVALRVHMVLLSARGYSVPQIAAIHDCGCDVVRHWLHHYAHECVHLLPVIRALWMQGPRVRVLTPGTNARRAFFGALEAVSGQWFSTDHDRKLAMHVVAFLKQLAVAYPTGPLYLALDNVKMHDATVVRAWLAANPRVQVLWLPRYAAHEVNSVERTWGLMKDDVAANRLAGSIEELTAKARRFFADLGAHPVSQPLAA